MGSNFIEAVQHVSEYFERYLPQYAIMEVRRQSYYTDDDYLYMVSAKRDDGTFAVWTSWNESIKSLNHGHYGFKTLEECAQFMSDKNAGGFITGMDGTL